MNHNSCLGLDHVDENYLKVPAVMNALDTEHRNASPKGTEEAGGE